MPMTIIVTRNVEDRYRGYLSSVMLEIAPGVYTSPQMTKGVRERVWNVVSNWYSALGRGSIVLTWREKSEPGGQAVLLLGEPPRTLYESDSALLVKREIGRR